MLYKCAAHVMIVATNIYTLNPRLKKESRRNFGILECGGPVFLSGKGSVNRPD